MDPAHEISEIIHESNCFLSSIVEKYLKYWTRISFTGGVPSGFMLLSQVKVRVSFSNKHQKVEAECCDFQEKLRNYNIFAEVKNV